MLTILSLSHWWCMKGYHIMMNKQRLGDTIYHESVHQLPGIEQLLWHEAVYTNLYMFLSELLKILVGTGLKHTFQLVLLCFHKVGSLKVCRKKVKQYYFLVKQNLKY